MIKKENGITLIALVITIIVLLILAGVAISAVTNDNGVMKKSSDAVSKTNIAAVKEEMEVALAEWKADYYEENISLEGRSATTASGATVSYEEEEIVYTSKKGNVYIGILDNGRIDKVVLSDEGSGKANLTDYEWTAKIPNDNWFADTSYYNTEWEGAGTQESPYLIKTVNDLAGLSYKVASGETYSNSVYFKLMKNLNMKDHIWVPIGGQSLDNVSEDGKYYKADVSKLFKGNFDGNGFSISGLYYDNLDDTFGKYVGLFGYVKGSSYSALIEIKDLNITDSYLCSNVFLGAVAGISDYCIINNCSVDSMIKGYNVCGGLVGSGTGIIDYGRFYGKIVAEDSNDRTCSVGGIMGRANSVTVRNCISDGEVICNGIVWEESYCGGIVGEAQSSTTPRIYNNIVLGTVRGGTRDCVGGITGFLHIESKIYNNVVISNVSAEGSPSSSGGCFGRTNSGNAIAEIGNMYVLKNDSVNSTLDMVKNQMCTINYKMVAFFDDLNSESFTYTNETSELDGYEGNLLTKLNKYVEEHPSDNLLRWKVDNTTGKLTFEK